MHLILPDGYYLIVIPLSMYVLLVSRVSSVNGSRRHYKVEKSNERASENPLKRNTIIR